jgi:diguanylate cyclase (GGDEF)-like protein/PAS domain S-box-containing protein
MGRQQRERQETSPDGARGNGARGSLTDADLAAMEHALGAAWLHSALDSTTGFVAVHDRDGALRYLSPSVQKVLGHAPEELIGPMPLDIIHPDDRDGTLETMAGVLDAPRRVVTLNLRARHREGSWRWLETHVVNLVDHPTVKGVVTSSWDVTDRREEREHAEAARRASEARFRAMAEHSSDILAVYGADGTLKYMSPSAERFFGLAADDAIGNRSLLEFVHPEDRRHHHLASLREQTGTAPPRLVRVRNHRGQWRWLEAITTNLLDDKNVQGYVANSRDITERVETTRALSEVNEALRRSNETLSAIFENSPLAIYAFDKDGIILFWNPGCQDVFGWTAEEAVGQNSPAVREADFESCADIRHRVMAGEVIHPVEGRRRTKDGREIDVTFAAAPMRDETGTITAVLALSYDITAQKESEHALRESEERFRALVQNASDIIAVLEGDGTVRYASPAAHRIFGYEEGAWLGRDVFELVHPDDREHVGVRFAECLATPGLTGLVEFRMRHVDHTWRIVDAVGNNLLDDPAVGGVIITARDVTQERQAEEAVRRSEERFRAMAQHASDIVAVLDADGSVQYSSPSASRILGYPDEDWLQRGAFDLVHPDDLGEVMRIFGRALEEPGPTRPTWVRVRHADGSWRWLEAIANNLLDEPAVGGIVVHARDVTEQREAAYALRRSERRYRGIVEDQTELICRYQSDTTMTFVNEAYARYFDESIDDELIGARFIELIDESDRDDTWAMIRSLTPTNPVVTHEHRVLAPDGDIRWQQWTNRVVLDDEGGIAEYQAVGRDVTDQRFAEDAARKSQALVSDQARVLQSIATGEELGAILDGLCRVVEQHVPGSHCSIQFFDEDGSTVHHGSVTGPPERRWSLPIMSSTDQRYLGTFSVSWDEPREPDAEHKGVVELLEDLAAIAIERKKYEAKLAHQAHHDPLTGLPNRMLFLEFLQLAMARARRYRSSVAVLFLDLDRFKVVNDSLGHDAGDELLVALGRRLRGVVRPGDTVARFGGDEFTVLCEDLPTADAREHAADVAERLLHVIQQPFLLDGDEQFLSASIGIALAGPGADRPEGLLRDADAAMYRAKERGKGRWELFDEIMRASARERLETENALHRALERGELRVHYQPVMSLRDQRCIGAEALVRWAHPDRGLITPEHFIDVAEETGLILPVGKWVIEEACRRSRQWRAVRGPSFVVSVNLSGRQLSNPELAEQVAAALDRTGADPAGLCFEITENVLMDDAEATIGAITSLKRLGVALSIDDFGTGYSSLGYLKRFPVDAVKVDRSFIDGLGSDSEDSAIVAAVVSLGHALGLTVIAEGVETDRQLSELVALGCDAAQGYLFAEPGPADDLLGCVDRSRLPVFPAPVD